MDRPIGFTDAQQANTLLAVLSDGLTQLVDGAYWQLSDEEQLDLARSLQTLGNRMAAAQVVAAGEIDLRGTATRRGCTDTGALLRDLLSIRPGQANTRVRLGRQILPQVLPTGDSVEPALPAMGAAFLDGAITLDHARTITATLKHLPRAVPTDVRQQAEQQLVQIAGTVDPQHFDVAAQHLATALDPDGRMDERDPAGKAEFTIGTRNTDTGLTPINGRLDDLSVDVVRRAIDALSAPHPADNGGEPDPRPAANRRAHALTEALRRGLDDGILGSHGGIRPHITVFLTWADIHNLTAKARLDNGTLLSSAQTRALLCDAQLIPVVLGQNSEILDVGTTQRTVPTGLRKALAIRDGGCTWPGCDRPASWTDAHHLVHWAHGGPTSLCNTTLLCPRHHTEIHKNEWQILLGADGKPDFIPPHWLDPHQKPRRNHHHYPHGAPPTATRQ